jgi:hypothetical protein
MRILSRLLVLLAALVAGSSFAEEITGLWQGKLGLSSNQTVDVQFDIRKATDGRYTATLNSPDGPIKNVAADSVTWAANKLTVAVSALSGAFEGELKGGNLDGKWTQPGNVLPLVLAPYRKPRLSEAAVKSLEGGWNGLVTLPIGTQTLITRFQADENGEMSGVLAVAEMPGAELPMSNIEFADNKLSFKVPRLQAQYTGTLSNNAFTGTWKQPGPAMPPEGLAVKLSKGDVAATVYPLKLDSASYAVLNGKWQGRLETSPQAQKASSTIALRFEANPSGQYVAFVDVPEQGAKNVPVSEATFIDNTLSLKLVSPAVRLMFSFSGTTLTGTWNGSPLVLKRQ